MITEWRCDQRKQTASFYSTSEHSSVCISNEIQVWVAKRFAKLKSRTKTLSASISVLNTLDLKYTKIYFSQRSYWHHKDMVGWLL